MKKVKAVLVRHGESTANRDKLLVGSVDVPLTEEGISELYDIKSKLDLPHTDMNFSSPLSRAINTSKILFGDDDLIIDEDYTEINFGVMEETPFKDMDTKKYFDDWLRDIVVEGAINYSEFSNRVLTAFERTVGIVVDRGHTSFSITSHSGVMKTIKIHYENINKFDFLSFKIFNGQSIVLDIDYDEITRKIVDVKINN